MEYRSEIEWRALVPSRNELVPGYPGGVSPLTHPVDGVRDFLIEHIIINRWRPPSENAGVGRAWESAFPRSSILCRRPQVLPFSQNGHLAVEGNGLKAVPQ